jgi:hypothetical protein
MPLRVAAQLPQSVLVGCARAWALLPIEPVHSWGRRYVSALAPPCGPTSSGSIPRYPHAAMRAWCSGLASSSKRHKPPPTSAPRSASTAAAARGVRVRVGKR